MLEKSIGPCGSGPASHTRFPNVNCNLFFLHICTAILAFEPDFTLAQHAISTVIHEQTYLVCSHIGPDFFPYRACIVAGMGSRVQAMEEPRVYSFGRVESAAAVPATAM